MHTDDVLRWRLRCVTAIVLGAGLTALVALVPALSFAVNAPLLRAVLETIVTLVGGFVSFLMVGRHRRRARRADLVIAMAFGVLSLEYPLLVALPATVPSGDLHDLGLWAYLVSTGCAAALMWWASGQEPDVPEAGERAKGVARLANLGPIYTAAAVGLASFVVLLYFGFDPDASISRRAVLDYPSLFALPGVSAIRLISCLLFLGAAIRFSSTRFPADDHLVGWLSIGCALLATGNLDHGLYPTLGSSMLHLGDVFRLASFLVFGVGGVAEIHAYWYESRELARLQERRAVARELHDGVAQELAFLRTHALSQVGPGLDATWLGQLQAATDRALAEARRAISALAAAQPLAPTLDIEQALREVVAHSDAALEIDIQPQSLDLIDVEVLIRILREAVINAIRHGRPRLVSVKFGGSDRPLLRICDDGVGFDVREAELTARGFGLVTMRERALSLGARFAIESRLGQGTTIELSWP